MEEWKKKPRLNFKEAMAALPVKSRQTIYTYLEKGYIQAHNPTGAPGGKGTMILTSSIIAFHAKGAIPKDKWTE